MAEAQQWRISHRRKVAKKFRLFSAEPQKTTPLSNLGEKAPPLSYSDAIIVVKNLSIHHENELLEEEDYFSSLPDDLIISIFCKLSSTASSPLDFVNVMSTCKRFQKLCMNRVVLFTANLKMLAVKAKNWSDCAHRFLLYCAIAGNLNACYILGMIKFYCLNERIKGLTLITKSAFGFNPQAIFSLAIINFNGSGRRTKEHKNIRAGMAYSIRAAMLGHLNALKEVGYCLQDGYGVPQDVKRGKHFLLHIAYGEMVGRFKAEEKHPANVFMVDWFEERRGFLEMNRMKLCFNGGCGRPETREKEFRRCSMCGKVNYCSRSCQAEDWKSKHWMECSRLLALAGEDG